MNEIFRKQNSDCIAHLIRLIDAKVVLEIGVCEACNADDILNSTKLHTLFGLDIKLSDRAKAVSKHHYPRYQLFEGDSTKIHTLFKDIKFDLIYVDGSHWYHDVKQDLENFYPLVREGGIFCGDDYDNITYDDGEVNGVIRAVNEFCQVQQKKLYISTVQDGTLEELAASRTKHSQCRWYITK